MWNVSICERSHIHIHVHVHVCTVLYTLCVFPGRYWEMVERLGVTQFYGAPTALRLLLKAGDEYVHKYDRSSLRILGCGEGREREWENRGRNKQGEKRREWVLGRLAFFPDDPHLGPAHHTYTETSLSYPF